AYAIESEQRNVVERPALAAVGGGVAPGGVFLPHEQIGDLIVVASGAAQPDDVPGILDVCLRAGEQHGAIDWIAACIPARLVGGFEPRRMPAHPGGVGAAARKSPFAGDAVAAVDNDGFGNPRGWPPCEQRVGCPKDLACNFRVEKSRRVGARNRLCETPGRTRIVRCHRLDDLLDWDDVAEAAAERHRQQHVEQAAGVHRRQDIGRNLPFLFGAAGSGLDHRCKGARPRDPILTVLGQQRSPPDVFTCLAQGKPHVGSRWRRDVPSTSIGAAPLSGAGPGCAGQIADATDQGRTRGARRAYRLPSNRDEPRAGRLSHAAGTDRRPLPRGWRHRYAGALARRPTQPQMGSTGDRREYWGAAGNIGSAEVARTTPDGYTLLLASPGPIATNAFLYKEMGYDPARWVPIALLATGPYVLVLRKNFEASNVADLIARAKANPGKITSATPGAGSVGHLATVQLEMLAGITTAQIPYRGLSHALNDLIAGHVDMMFDTPTTSLALHRDGKVKIVAVGTTERVRDLPEVPTVAESGLPGYRAVTWYAMVAPPQTPAALADKINRDVVEILARPEVAEKTRGIQMEPVTKSRGEAAQFFVEEAQLWGKVIRQANIPQQ